MRRDPDGPADTRMMGIVHGALCRDLDRLRAELTTPPFPDGARKVALADHVEWLMDFLHEHHAGEDEGLFPMVRRKDTAATALFDGLDDDHRRIDPAATALRAAAAAWRSGGDEERRALVAALAELDGLLRPHLQREETEAMPVAARAVTQREWHEWDQAHNIKPKTPSQLGEQGHWLIDGLDEQRRRIVLQQVPLVPRYLLLWGFGPRYRRRAAARWSEASRGIR